MQISVFEFSREAFPTGWHVAFIRFYFSLTM